MIRIIITGGTFDKNYDAVRGELSFTHSHLPGILEQVRCRAAVQLEINQLVDSLEMGSEDREGIVTACKSARERRIVITHGTDTMTRTADAIRNAELDKTIVLTGAMVPFSVTGSDAVFNLGGALTAVQLLSSGVYIVMHGEIFSSGSVRKNRELGFFESQ